MHIFERFVDIGEKAGHVLIIEIKLRALVELVRR